MNVPAPASSPTRSHLEQLLGDLARTYVASLSPMERTLVLGLTRARGWDLDRLASGSGPLATVSDWSLSILVLDWHAELGKVPVVEDAQLTDANRAAAYAELKGAMA